MKLALVDSLIPTLTVITTKSNEKLDISSLKTHRRNKEPE
jgi:hypothetical protein